MEKNNKNKIIIAVIILLVLIAIGYIIVTKVLSNNTNNTIEKHDSINQNPLYHDNNQYEITEQETNEINDLMRNNNNNSSKAIMQFASFTEPSKLLNNDSKYYIQMILSHSEYADKFEDVGMGGSYITLSEIKEQLKVLTNYEYPDEEVKSYFNEFYKNDTKTYFIPVPGGSAEIGTVKNGYRIDDKYYITLTNGINIVLEKLVDQYFYYSSTGEIKK